MATQVRVGVGVFVFNNKGEVLVGQRKGSHGAGTWQLPGGHLHFGESFEACAEREVMEETGLSIKEPRCLAVTNDFMPNEGKHYVTIFMGVDLASNGQTGPVSDEEQEPKIMEPDKCACWEWVRWDQVLAYYDEQIRAEERGGSEDFEGRKLFLPLLNLIGEKPSFQPSRDYYFGSA